MGLVYLFNVHTYDTVVAATFTTQFIRLLSADENKVFDYYYNIELIYYVNNFT